MDRPMTRNAMQHYVHIRICRRQARMMLILGLGIGVIIGIITGLLAGGPHVL
jgi:hypothetical protein